MVKADCNHSITATRGSQLLTCPPVHSGGFFLVGAKTNNTDRAAATPMLSRSGTAGDHNQLSTLFCDSARSEQCGLGHAMCTRTVVWSRSLTPYFHASADQQLFRSGRMQSALRASIDRMRTMAKSFRGFLPASRCRGGRGAKVLTMGALVRFRVTSPNQENGFVGQSAIPFPLI